MAHRIAAIVQARLRRTIYDHVVALGPAYVAGTRTGEIIVSMVAGVTQASVGRRLATNEFGRTGAYA